MADLSDRAAKSVAGPLVQIPVPVSLASLALYLGRRVFYFQLIG